jgi:hypothetical protein
MTADPRNLMIARAACGNCTFWFPPPPDSEPNVPGLCHYAPPTVFVAVSDPTRDKLSWRGLWPPTASSEWCGQHSLRQ